MIKINKKHLLVVSIMFFIFVSKTDANIIINEIQVSPTENRFIELYNNGSNSVDLTGWYIQRKTATGSSFGSLISKTYFEGKNINSNSYLVISKADLSNSSIIYDGLTLTESNSIQIKNNSGDIVDKVGMGESLDCIDICIPNPTEGKSVARASSGKWIISSSSPGYSNFESSGGTIGSSVDNINTSISSSDPTIYNSSKIDINISKTSTKIIIPKVVTAGVPFTIDHNTIGTRKEKIILGKFVWNFGDGIKKELSISNPFEYIYQYPGDYVITLSYSSSLLNENPDTADRVVVKVIPSGLTVSSVGTYKDPYVEIENTSNYEISLNDFIIKGNNHTFILPDGTVILPNKKLKLSPKITSFDINDLSSVSIFDNTGQVFATYPVKRIDQVIRNTNIKPFTNNITEPKVPENNQINSDDNVINLNDIGASVSNTSSENITKNNLYPWLGLGGIIFIGLTSVALFRRKGREYQDYVEKELSAKDMTIIE